MYPSTWLAESPFTTSSIRQPSSACRRIWTICVSPNKLCRSPRVSVGNYRRLRDFVADIDTKSRVQYGGDYMAQSNIGTAAATGIDLARRLGDAAS
jgi:hypothetical protein